MISNDVYKFFANMIFEKTGIHYPEKDFYRLDSRINTLVDSFDVNDANELKQLFILNPTKALETKFVDICTNNETYFFRDEKPFKALSEVLIPQYLEQNKRNINIWSCASSTGQEALSILMTFDEKLEALKQSMNVYVDATDISHEVLEKAKSGITGLEVQRGLPVTKLVKYFEQLEDNCWMAKSLIHSKIKYGYLNLFEKKYPINAYDIIFCRNVLIYQTTENKAMILEQMISSMKPGGYLVLGAGESLIGTNVKLKQVSVNGSMFFQKEE